MKFVPRLVAWELTNRCNLRCRHCRAADAGDPVPDELTPDEAQTLIEQIAEFAPLTLILSGGEPTVREDFMDIVRSGIRHKLRVAVATNGVCLNEAMAQSLKAEGVSRISLSLDGADAQTHDGLRGLEGAYDRLLGAAALLKRVGLPFQINTTVTKNNVEQLPKIVEFVPTLGAVEHHVFMFVPTGRGETMADESLGAEAYENTLRWLAKAQESAPLHIQVTCGPHYQRILRQEGYIDPSKESSRRRGGGCLAGTAFAFVSARGEVMPCGYLPIPAGDVRIQSFGEIWRSSALFNDLRDRKRLQGRCGACEYRRVCGGCRARAYAVSGDVSGEEPYCAHEPARLKRI
jgi:radical SAM protein with 4Fe4S-binding SPASM domain